MKLLRKPFAWVALLGLVVLGGWTQGFLNQFLPSPQRIWLATKNQFHPPPPATDERFRFVLCWLENDEKGENTRIVGNAFQRITGVKLFRSAREVKAEGAADEWRPAMEKQAREELDRWGGDVAIVGRVDVDKQALSVWFVPQKGEGTLNFGNNITYPLEQGKIQPDFREHLGTQIAGLAFTAVAPLANTEVRGGILTTGLLEAVGQLGRLLEGNLVTDANLRATLQEAYGNALTTLGERKGNQERLEEAVTAYQAALEERTRERVPLQWAATQNNLGNALSSLGERESGTARLEEAVTAYQAALEEQTRERVPLDWAATQNNLGIALSSLGERESGTARLEEAVTAYQAALEERTRERVPLDWAATQNNLGNALRSLGERESGTARLEEAVTAYQAALEEFTEENAPHYWTVTQQNLENARRALDKKELN